VFNRRPPLFSCIRLRKRQQRCKTKIGETLKLPTSFHPNQARIKFSTRQCMKEVLCDIAPTNPCHLLLTWAWLHFTMLNLDERSLYLRHEGHEMKLKFLAPREAKMDQHTLKEKIEKERLKKKKTKVQKEGKLRKRKGSKEKDYGKGSREHGF